MKKISISPIDVRVTNYKSRKSREKVDPCIECYSSLDLGCWPDTERIFQFRFFLCLCKTYFYCNQELSPRLFRHSTFVLENVRYFSTGFVFNKNIRSGVPKISKNRSKPLTYEMSQGPSKIGVTKTWNSWNTSMFVHQFVIYL